MYSVFYLIFCRVVEIAQNKLLVLYLCTNYYPNIKSRISDQVAL